jgi:hypothetical protein
MYPSIIAGSLCSVGTEWFENLIFTKAGIFLEV